MNVSQSDMTANTREDDVAVKCGTCVICQLNSFGLRVHCASKFVKYFKLSLTHIFVLFIYMYIYISTCMYVTYKLISFVLSNSNLIAVSFNVLKAVDQRLQLLGIAHELHNSYTFPTALAIVSQIDDEVGSTCATIGR